MRDSILVLRNAYQTESAMDLRHTNDSTIDMVLEAAVAVVE